MIQNQFENATRDQSLLYNTQAVLEREAHKIDRQVPWVLATSLQGELVLPGDDEYAEARTVWNGAIDLHPALIVRCLNTSDVITAITFAREHHLLVSVRSGGHSIAGYGTNNGGMVIDLSRMKAITIDPSKLMARIEPGLTWAEVAQAAHPYGLALTSGDTGSVGVGGLLLGGGMGWMVRKYGLTIDRLRAVELVTADGQFLRVSADQHADLFWGCVVVAATLALRLPSRSTCTLQAWCSVVPSFTMRLMRTMLIVWCELMLIMQLLRQMSSLPLVCSSLRHQRRSSHKRIRESLSS
jgi:FAD binding domain